MQRPMYEVDIIELVLTLMLSSLWQIWPREPQNIACFKDLSSYI